MKNTIPEIHRIFKNLIFKGYNGGQMKLTENIGASGFYNHGRKSKIVLWDAKTGINIAIIDYSIRRKLKNEK